jgi:Formyl transferase
VKITLFTGRQPRHSYLASKLADQASEILLVREQAPVASGQAFTSAADEAVMRRYFGHVADAERQVFGAAGPPKAGNIHEIELPPGSLNAAPPLALKAALDADFFVVYGSSYIREPLVSLLIERQAVNVHIGVSPFYRGSACNFWALFDGRPDLVGATIHMLGRGLDDGPILYHAFPERAPCDLFEYGMRSVRAAHDCLIQAIQDHTLLTCARVPQNSKLQLRYSRIAEFTPAIADEYLSRDLRWDKIDAKIMARRNDRFVRTYQA